MKQKLVLLLCVLLLFGFFATGCSSPSLKDTITPETTKTTIALLPTAIGGGTGRIAFSAEYNGNRDIYVIDADGSHETRLTNYEDWDWSPAWSPDGKQIAFLSIRDGNSEIYIMDADGANIKRLTLNQSYEGYPMWSPDGKNIAFVSDKDEPDPAGCVNSPTGCNSNIYLININSLNETRLTDSPSLDESPSWSPDGTQIVFYSNRDGNNEIYLMKADGSNTTRLTSNPADDWRPRWSPDGKHIVFVSFRDDNSEIYMMEADGSNVIRLTDNQVDDSAPSWSPDGQNIAYHSSSSDENAKICSMDFDGSNMNCLTNNLTNAWEPVWQPFTTEPYNLPTNNTSTTQISTPTLSPEPTLEPTLEPTFEPTPEPACDIASSIKNEWPIIYCEEFDDNRNNWVLGQFDEDLVTTTTKIENGKLIIEKIGKPTSGYTGGVVSWHELVSTSDFAVTATVKIDSKNRDVSWGFVFRNDLINSKNLYDFEIFKQGYYNFLKLNDGVWTPLLLNKSNSSIKWDEENTLTIVGEGNEFTFYVNGQLINSYSDSSIKGTVISLAMTQAEGASATYTIDNILVRAPDLSTTIPAETPGSVTSLTYWNGIPIIPGAENGQEYLGDYKFTTNASATAIKEYYQQEMAKLGWELRPELMVKIPTDLAFNKGSTFAFILIQSEDDNNVVFIHLFQE